jgi:antitoxin (DNA-binding transcriptional repressor) of toxin-antitoxin stability system
MGERDYICLSIRYALKEEDMLVISTREFREKQGLYLHRVRNGENIVLRSRENGSFRLVPVAEDDTLMSREDLDAVIERGLEDIENGKGKSYTMEELRIKMGL